MGFTTLFKKGSTILFTFQQINSIQNATVLIFSAVWNWTSFQTYIYLVLCKEKKTNKKVSIKQWHKCELNCLRLQTNFFNFHIREQEDFYKFLDKIYWNILNISQLFEGEVWALLRYIKYTKLTECFFFSQIPCFIKIFICLQLVLYNINKLWEIKIIHSLLYSMFVMQQVHSEYMKFCLNCFAKMPIWLKIAQDKNIEVKDIFLKSCDTFATYVPTSDTSYRLKSLLLQF